MRQNKMATNFFCHCESAVPYNPLPPIGVLPLIRGRVVTAELHISKFPSFKRRVAREVRWIASLISRTSATDTGMTAKMTFRELPKRSGGEASITER
jgi:hypothetical protein